jgi:transcriptional regulator with XRE-family HTH domain
MTDDFPQLLKKHRERAGLSQNQLAAQCGICHSYVSRIEQGNRFPSVETADILARNLHLNPTEYDVFMGAAGFGVTNLRNAVHEPMVIDLDDLIANSIPDIANGIRAVLRLLLHNHKAMTT